jgi:hypothetical protein
MLNKLALTCSTAAGACLLAATLAGAADQPSPKDTNMTPVNTSGNAVNVNELVVSYIASWNEADPKRRRELVAKTWTAGGSYVDAHRRGEGHESIDGMIAKAQEQFPGYRIRLVSKIETHNGRLRFSWAAGGTDQAPLYLAGTDFVQLSNDGRFQTVTGFVDASPAPVTPR